MQGIEPLLLDPGAVANPREAAWFGAGWRWLSNHRTLALSGAALLALGLAIIFLGTNFAYEPAPTTFAYAAPELPADGAGLQRAVTRLTRERTQLLARLEKKRQKGVYIVVDQTENRLYLMRDSEVVREAVASAGSGMILKEGPGGRVWVFDTPRGIFRVSSKLSNPVWKKPDWAFVEEGRPIPTNPKDRFDYGVLGEYALYFGNGYMIHGTLYERLLGRSVTHGCIRLGRDDLREVYSAAKIGTPIYIY